MEVQERQIGKTILEQLGGGRFQVMTGAKAVGIQDGLLLQLKMTKIAKYLEIKLNGMDLYDLTFYNFNKKDWKKVIKKEIKDVYCDQLVAIFERETKLYTSL